MTAAQNTAPIIETKACSRCGGSGEYSYDQLHGKTCYGCGGSGKQYTPRGKAVAAFWKASTTIAMEDVTEGMRIKFESHMSIITATIARVVSEGDATVITTAGGKEYGYHGAGFTARVVPAGEALADLRSRAAAYRDSLTLAGKPRKCPA